MSWHWSATVGFALASCGGAGRAVPTEIEIEWPDAGVEAQQAPVGPAEAEQVDAGMATAIVEDASPPKASAPAPE